MPSESKEKAHVYLFTNGLIACFDSKDEQVPSIQKKGWIDLICKHLERNGFDAEQSIIEMQGTGVLKVKKGANGYWIERG